MNGPWIGVVAYHLAPGRVAKWLVGGYGVPENYVDAIRRAGGHPVLLLPGEDVSAEDLLGRVDALMLVGGGDVEPARYGASTDDHTYGVERDRDALEIDLLRAADAGEVPTLAICRGMQVMNVARGGTLIEHLPDVVGHEDHRAVPGAFGDHDVRLQDGSLAARVAGEATHPTKSHHHQGVDRPGEGFQVTGWATVDDLPEAIEDPSRRFALGVQWHPEADPTSPLIAALVEEAKSR
jgi:putative glutamine amidotransferase